MIIAVNARFLLKNRLEGIGLFTHEVLRRLTVQHPEHEFIFFFDRPFSPDFIDRNNITPVVLPPPARHPFLFVWWFEWSVARALKKYKADVFLSPDNFLCLRTGVKTILVTHDLAHVHFPGQLPFFHRLYYRLFSPKFNRRADRIVAVSEFTKQDLMAQYYIPAEKIAVACNGCREIFKPLQTSEIQAVRIQYSGGQPYFFYVGAVHPRKNVHRLIAAFDRFKTETNAPAKLLVAGRFAWKAGEVSDAWKTARHQPDIQFLGYVNEAELARLMGAAFACAYVSLFEGFGVPVLEAMHCDVPVITSNVSSLPEVAGDAALLVDPFSVEEIAGAMHQLWTDSHLRNELITAGKRQRLRFDWETAADTVYQCIENL
jgi:glycosyltransferase involved in cell wall biosynthesis